MNHLFVPIFKFCPLITKHLTLFRDRVSVHEERAICLCSHVPILYCASIRAPIEERGITVKALNTLHRLNVFEPQL